MQPRSQQPPAWRLFGAALGALASAVQVLLTGWLIGQAASAADGLELAVICTHDHAAPTDGGGAPAAPQSHGQCCPACPCPQGAKLLAPLPDVVFVAVPRPRSQALRPAAAPRHTTLDFHAPYSSRAPPRSA